MYRPRSAAVEPAPPIRKPALRRRELDERTLAQIKRPHALDDRSHILPIRAHILHRRPARAPRNPRQAFDPRAPIRNGAPDKAVPIFAGADTKHLAIPLDALHCNMQHKPRKSLIGHQHVAAAA